MTPAAPLIPDACAKKFVEVIGVECREPDDDEHRQHAELDAHHDRVDRRGLRGTADEQEHAQDDQHDGGQVHDAAGRDAIVSGHERGGQLLRQPPSEEVVQQLVEVSAPSDRDRRYGDAVFQQHAAADEDRRALAECVIGEGVARAAHRDR